MRLHELEQGYKMVKGAPEYKPDGAKVSPFYQKELGPGWDKKSLDRAQLRDLSQQYDSRFRRDMSLFRFVI